MKLVKGPANQWRCRVKFARVHGLRDLKCSQLKQDQKLLFFWIQNGDHSRSDNIPKISGSDFSSSVIGIGVLKGRKFFASRAAYRRAQHSSKSSQLVLHLTWLAGFLSVMTSHPSLQKVSKGLAGSAFLRDLNSRESGGWWTLLSGWVLAGCRQKKHFYKTHRVS